jgi:hypothetical protein
MGTAGFSTPNSGELAVPSTWKLELLCIDLGGSWLLESIGSFCDFVVGSFLQVFPHLLLMKLAVTEFSL